MPKHILIVWNITEAVGIKNSASSGTKDTSNLEKDNFLYIDVLDYWTNLIKIFFKIPWVDTDIKWVDLIYESSIDNSKKLIDIKTQANIRDFVNLYIREFSKEKISNRNYIIFNKVNKKLFWRIYFISAELINNLVKNNIFTDFLENIKIFEDLTQNYILKDKTLNKSFKKLKEQYNNTEIIIDWTLIKIIFLKARKDKSWVAWNTSFKENIKLEISV